MNCQQANHLWVAYLDGEVSPLEKQALHTHLASCQVCQEELDGLDALQGQLRLALHQRAAGAAPSPRAWNRLQSRLDHDGTISLGRSWQQIGASLRLPPLGRRLALTGLTLLVLLVSSVAFVPAVRAQVSELISAWFSFETPSGNTQASIGDFTAFTPFNPSYLPADFDLVEMGSHTSPEVDSLTLTYAHAQAFVRLVQSAGTGLPALPAGVQMRVNGRAAILRDQLNAQEASLLEPYNPLEARSLTWRIGRVNIQLFSNLPTEEMIRIAESLTPMRSGK